MTGCKHGCKYCYARKIANRFGGNSAKNISCAVSHFKYNNTISFRYELDKPAKRRDEHLKLVSAPYPFDFAPTLHRYRLSEYEKKESRTIFVCSMADLFGNWVPDSWIEEVFAACDKAPQHRYLFLTKNPFRYEQLHQKGILRKSDNMWYGFSATKATHDYWLDTQYNTFVSVEPILEAVDVSAEEPKWIIIGAESGNRQGKVIPEKEWIDNICKAAAITHTPVFMKDSLVPIVGEENMRREFPWNMN